MTKAGTILCFVDDKKPSVYLKTPGNNKMLLDDNGKQISITDQNGNSIIMSKKGITIKSAKDLKVEASGNIELKGIKVDVK